ncbi:CBS domain-containing protein [Bacteriovoracaceae bacterium]|nr:CBS domain-containing protein [Bacteriovoracaceae bacterium]
MSFYVLSKGNLTGIEFDYLSGPNGERLEATLVPGMVMAKNEKLGSGAKAYAIEIMSSPVFSIDAKETVDVALQTLKEKKIHHLVLTQGQSVKGLISDRDLSWLQKFELDKNAKVFQFMSNMILACHEETRIDHIAKVMVKENISAIPVVDSSSQLVGIVTHHDLLRWIYDQ